MIIERHSIAGNTGVGGKLSDFTELFDTLCEWDNRAEGENSVTYSYGGADIKIAVISSYINIQITIGTYSGSVTSQSSASYINLLIVKTASSVGMMIQPGKENDFASMSTGGAFSSQLRFVLTKCMNLNTGAEEKGIVLHYSNGYSYAHTIVSSENEIISAAAQTYFNANAAATVLYPATSLAYPGYCPHVFIPVFQDCGYINHKVTVNGSDYYILGGTMYLLDD